MRKFVIFSISLFFIFSCNENKNGKIGSCYMCKDESIVYLMRNSTGSIDSIQLKDANADHFELVYDEMPGDECYNAYIWAKDKSNVWFKNHLLKGANPETFVVLENGYSKDNKYVYYLDKTLPDAKPEEFQTLGWFYAKTNSGIWYCGKPVSGIEDVPTFKVFDSYFSKDKAGVYITNDSVFKKIEGSLPFTFKCITDDKAFRLTGLKWYADDQRVYCVNTSIEPDSDEFLTIINTKAKTFEILSEKFYSKDETTVYYKNYPIKNASPESFQTLGLDYAKDSLFVYFRDQKLSGVNVKSFIVVEPGGAFDATDKNKRFLKGKKIN